MLPFDILYEDASLMVINKPAGLMVEKDRYDHPSVQEAIETYFSEKRVSQNTILGIVHRIDRPVSGVLLLAKKRSVLKELNRQFEEQEIEKVYEAFIEGKPAKEEAHLQHYLRRDQKNKIAIVYKNKREHTAKCELIYKVVSEHQRGCLVEVHLLTGRYHQIRAQMAYIGCPVWGDKTYGATTSFRNDTICLHAFSVEFFHPVLKEKMKVMASHPAGWPSD